MNLNTRRLAPIAAMLATACIQPLRLAHDDSPTVLSQQLLTAPNPGERGTFAIKTMYYGSGHDRRRPEYRDSVTLKTRSVNGAKLASAPTPALDKSRKKYWGFGFDSMPVNGRVWYPVGAGPFPVVLIVHGNHEMEKYSDPGYAYLGELFASRGFITVSVDENFLNGNIRGENDARGWMLLQHLKAWRGFNDSTISPFYQKVDLSRVTLMGHSRGGEAVAVAAAFNTLKYYPDDANVKFDFHFGIRSIVAIAPVDGQYQPANRPTPLENVSYLVIHGSHDGDVSSFSGLRAVRARDVFAGTSRVQGSRVDVSRQSWSMEHRLGEHRQRTAERAESRPPRIDRARGTAQDGAHLSVCVHRGNTARPRRVPADLSRLSRDRSVAPQDDVHLAIPGRGVPHARRLSGGC